MFWKGRMRENNRQCPERAEDRGVEAIKAEGMGRDMKRGRTIWNVLGLAAFLLLAGCGREEEIPNDVLAEGITPGENVPGEGQGAGTAAGNNGTSGGTGESAGLSWQDNHVALGGYLEDAIVRDGVVYGYYMENGNTVVVSQDTRSGAVLSETAISGLTEPGNITADAQGNIYVSGEESFRKISTGGEITIFGDFELEDMEDAEIEQPRGIYVDSEGRFYLRYEMMMPANLFYEEEAPNVYSLADRIYIKDSQLTSLFYIQIPSSKGSRLLSFFLTRRDSRWFWQKIRRVLTSVG